MQDTVRRSRYGALSSDESVALVRDVVGLIQAFGVLRADSTPCGQPMSVSTAHALCELANGGPRSQKDLARKLGLESSSVSRLVDRIETNGWARRVAASAADSRIRLVELTPKGLEIAGEVLEARAERFAGLYEAIPAEKRAQVLEALGLLRKAAHALD